MQQTTGEDIIKMLSPYATKAAEKRLLALQNETKWCTTEHRYSFTEADYLAADRASPDLLGRQARKLEAVEYSTSRIPLATIWHQLAEELGRCPTGDQWLRYCEEEAADDFVLPCSVNLACRWTDEDIARGCRWRLAKAHFGFLREGIAAARLKSLGFTVIFHPVADVTFGSDLIVIGPHRPIPVCIMKRNFTFYGAEGQGYKDGARRRLTLQGVCAEAKGTYKPNGNGCAILMTDHEIAAMADGICEIIDAQNAEGEASVRRMIGLKRSRGSFGGQVRSGCFAA